MKLNHQPCNLVIWWLGRAYGTPDTKTTYIYNGLRVVEELDDSDALAMEYVHGKMYIYEIILQDDQTTIYNFAHDRRYSTTALMNTSGSVVESFEYKVYGKRVASGSGLTEMGYTGRRHDDETGLMFFRNRYYSVDRGSFVTRDPMGYVDGYSMYLGCFGKQGRDPSGKEIYIVIDPSKRKDKYRKLVINGEEIEGTNEYKKAFEAIIKTWNKDIDTYIEMANRAPDTAKITLNGKENAKKSEVISVLKSHRINEKITVLPANKKAAAQALTDLANGLTENDQVYMKHTRTVVMRPLRLDIFI